MRRLFCFKSYHNVFIQCFYVRSDPFIVTEKPPLTPHVSLFNHLTHQQVSVISEPAVSCSRDFVSPTESVLYLQPPTPAVGLIKTISRTKEGSLLYHTTSSATDMVPEGRSCQGLVPLRRRRWIYQPPHPPVMRV